MTIKYDDETGQPQPDGYWRVYIAGPKLPRIADQDNLPLIREYPFSEFECQMLGLGFQVADKKQSVVQYVPAHRVLEAHCFLNTDEFIEAYRMWQLECDHDYKHNHGLMEPCIERCTKCGIEEPAKEGAHDSEE